MNENESKYVPENVKDYDGEVIPRYRLPLETEFSLPSELYIRLTLIAKRRGISYSTALLYAVQDFVAADLVEKKDDLHVQYYDPSKDLIGDSVRLGGSLWSRFPSALNCPQDQLESWITALRSDLNLMESKLPSQSEEPDLHRSFSDTMRAYRNLLNNLEKRPRAPRNSNQ